MKKRGLIVVLIGLLLVGIALSVITFTIPSNITDSSMASMFESMFDEITTEIEIMPGDSAFVSYDASSYDSSLLWGIQNIGYVSGDALYIKISNIFGDDYGEFVMSEPILFDVLNVFQSDSLNFEIKNTGSKTVSIIMMFSENPENSDALSNPDSKIMNMVVPLVISGFLLILGIIVSIIGVIVILVDLKNNSDDKRNY